MKSTPTVGQGDAASLRLQSLSLVLAAILTLLLSLMRAHAGGHQPLQQVSDWRFSVEVEMVGLFATVQDRSGKLITGLDQDDFLIYDEGTPQVISQFSREYTPLSVSILLDTSSSMAGRKIENARKSLGEFLRFLNRGDEAMLMTFRTRPQLVHKFTQDLGSLRRSLRNIEGFGSTALYDAILAALEHSKASQNRRRALLLISDGINTYGRAELKETVEQLRRQGVELFAIGMETNLSYDLQDKLVTRFVLNQLTRSAGGEAFMVNDPAQLGDVCEAISERMRKQYAFGYYPPKATSGDWRSIRIETRRPGMKVIPSKTGYYPSPGENGAIPSGDEKKQEARSRKNGL
jgi:Ca-activated chloride channel family protein